jgi:hypothetical protein
MKLGWDALKVLVTWSFGGDSSVRNDITGPRRITIIDARLKHG